MKGTTFKRVLPSGRVSWEIQIDAGRDEHGKRKRISRSGFARKSNADDALAKLLGERSDGSLVRPDPRTFAEFVEAWLTEHAEISNAPKTAEVYRGLLAHVTRKLGTQALGKVTTLQLQRVYNGLLKSGKADGTGHAIKTVRSVHTTVHVALETAVAWGLLKSNPASRCKLPKVPKREAIALDFTAARRLLDASAGHWLADYIAVDMACGARRGELLALAWPDVDLESGSIIISKSLEQTKAGLRLKETKGRNVRTVGLPPDAITTLKRVKAVQDETRNLYGPDYRLDLDLVFCQPSGDFMRPDVVSKAVMRLAKKAGFSRVHLHTLRHSYGSQLLSAGVPLPAVSALLGHASVYVTATIYAHALSDDKTGAAAKWQEAMKRADNSKVIEMPTKLPSKSGVAANGSTNAVSLEKDTEKKTG